MSNIKESNKPNNTLIRYTNEDDLALKRDIFTSFVEIWSDINPKLNNIDYKIAQNCIEEDGITAGELERALLKAYKDPDRYGKVEWNHIWEHIKSNREDTKPSRAELHRKAEQQ